MKDKAHLELLKDLKVLLAEATAGEFHDFNNKKYFAPKVILAHKLKKLREKVLKGEYDNI